jgi:hypothetical protein
MKGNETMEWIIFNNVLLQSRTVDVDGMNKFTDSLPYMEIGETIEFNQYNTIERVK